MLLYLLYDNTVFVIYFLISFSSLSSLSFHFSDPLHRYFISLSLSFSLSLWSCSVFFIFTSCYVSSFFLLLFFSSSPFTILFLTLLLIVTLFLLLSLSAFRLWSCCVCYLPPITFLLITLFLLISLYLTFSLPLTSLSSSSSSLGFRLLLQSPLSLSFIFHAVIFLAGLTSRSSLSLLVYESVEVDVFFIFILLSFRHFSVHIFALTSFLLHY